MSQHYRDGGRFGDMKGMEGILDDQLVRQYKYEEKQEHIKEQVPRRLDAHVRARSSPKKFDKTEQVNTKELIFKGIFRSVREE